MLVSTGCYSPASIIVKDFDADKDGTLNEAGLISSTDPADCKPGNNGKTLGNNLAMLCLCWWWGKGSGIMMEHVSLHETVQEAEEIAFVAIV